MEEDEEEGRRWTWKKMNKRMLTGEGENERRWTRENEHEISSWLFKFRLNSKIEKSEKYREKKSEKDSIPIIYTTAIGPCPSTQPKT